MKHYNDVAMTSPLPLLQAARIGCGRNRCCRFNKFFLPANCWRYNRGLPDNIHFSVSKPIKLFGVQHFGSEGGEHTVSTEVKDTTKECYVIKRSGTYSSEKDETNNYYAFDVFFDRPVCLEANKQYTLVSLIKGPKSWSGKDGRASVESGRVRFTFSRSNDRGNPNGTMVVTGQFPALIFS